ncbi:MAG: tetratricopeptide repeat protein [Pseudomonadota bacterium]
MASGAAFSPGETAEAVTPPSLTAVANADAAHAAGRHTEAAEAYQALAQASPRNAYFWFRLGSCRLQLRQHAQAITALEQAVALDPHEGRFAYNLAMAHSAVARDAFAQARAQLPPGSPWRSAAQQHRLLLDSVLGPPPEAGQP